MVFPAGQERNTARFGQSQSLNLAVFIIAQQRIVHNDGEQGHGRYSDKKIAHGLPLGSSPHLPSEDGAESCRGQANGSHIHGLF